MNKVFRAILLLGAVLLFAGNVWALPVAGGTINMGLDSTVPYTLTDLSDDQVYLSFCLERNNYFSTGEDYKVQSIGNTVYGGSTKGGDPLDDNTKWLYAAYMSGVFDKLSNAATLVQNAIWYLEDESPTWQDGPSALKEWESAWDRLNDFTFDDTGWTVVAVNLAPLNLVSFLGSDIQSQLIGTGPVTTEPVPEPATMLLLGTGLIGMAGLGRWRMKSHK